MIKPDNLETKPKTKTETRREFLKQSTRAAAFGGLIFFTVFLGKRNRFSSKFSCMDNSSCQGCGKLSSCKEPKAAAFKQNNKDGGLKSVR